MHCLIYFRTTIAKIISNRALGRIFFYDEAPTFFYERRPKRTSRNKRHIVARRIDGQSTDQKNNGDRERNKWNTKNI